MSVVLYGCESWSFKLRDERRLRVFENKLLRIMFGTKQDKVIEMWRKIQDEELKDPYSFTNIIWVIQSRRWAGQVLGREELRTGCVGGGGNYRERVYLEDAGIERRII